jgi:hypothetical protein
MNQRVRCSHCHQWTDALLVWAARDCCPSCNAPIAGLGPEQDRPSAAGGLHEPGRIIGSKQPGRRSPERLGERA